MKYTLKLMFITAVAVSLFSCSPEEESSANQIGDLPAEDGSALSAIALFDESSTIVSPDLVSCTLSGGTETECFKVTVTQLQTEHATGPWCPRNINDGPEESGIWLESGKVYDADGEFIENLADFYNDEQWQLFNPETGEIKVTDSLESCEAAARPDVDVAYQNYCVECLPSYVDVDVEAITYLIPAQPVKLDTPASDNPRGGFGLAFNGVKFDAPAPVDAILGAYTIAAFDDCGGHVNPFAGYHYHAVTGCTKEVASVDGHAPSIGYAFDGYMIHTQLNADGSVPDDLDVCGGHEVEGVGYHYHANDAGENQILGCFVAEQGCAVDADSSSCEANNERRPPGRPE